MSQLSVYALLSSEIGSCRVLKPFGGWIMTGRPGTWARAGAVLIFLQMVLLATLTVPVAAADALDTAIGKLVEGTFGPKPCVQDVRRTVGMWVFEEGKVPLGAAAAKRLHEELLSRLLVVRPKCIDVLDSAGIGTVIAHLNKSGALAENGGSVVAALTAAHQNVDLVAIPSLYLQAGKTVLAMRTVERVSGKTLALTAPVIVPEKFLAQDNISDPAITLDAAIKAATRYFMDSARDLKELRTLGIFFEETSAQPAAGRYVLDLLIAYLTQDPANVLTGKTLKVRGLTVEPVTKDDGTVTAQQLEPANDEESGYDLSGRYWIRGNVVDLRLSLKRHDGVTLAWQGTVRIADFKNLELRPSNPAAASQPLPKTFAFQVTSPKGAGPVYQPGDELKLFLRLGQDAYVYCFYVDTKGGVLTVLPNKFRADDQNANRFAAKVLHHLPDDAKDPFRFRFTADTLGEELVVCFASSRNVHTDLPADLFPDQIRVLPFLGLDRLRQLFAGLRDTKVSEASVTVTVAR